jgi:hypothetical protein
VQSGVDARTVICRIGPISRPYSWICDNCFDNIGGEDYWGELCPPSPACDFNWLIIRPVCPECTDAEFNLCIRCHDADEPYCNDLSHSGNFIRYHGVEKWVQCPRVRNPPNGGELRCSKCYQNVGWLYFRKCVMLSPFTVHICLSNEIGVHALR